MTAASLRPDPGLFTIISKRTNGLSPRARDLRPFTSRTSCHCGD